MQKKLCRCYRTWHRRTPSINILICSHVKKSIVSVLLLCQPTAVFAVALVVISLFTPLFASAVQNSALGGIDRGLGFIFGVLRGAILVAIAFLIYDRVIVSDPMPMIDDSRSKIVFDQATERLDEELPQDIPGWIAERYEELISKAQ